VLPDGIRALVYSKATAGRFNEKGRRIFNDADLTLAQEWMAAKMAPNSVVSVAKELNGRENRGQEWALHRPMQGVASSAYLTATHENRYFVGDLRFLSGDDQRKAASFSMVTLGPYVYIDRDAPRGPLEAFAFEEREPNILEWYLSNPTEPVRKVRPDPWATWELREHYDQQPNPPPPGAPRSVEEIRIAHNLAVATGDNASADRWNDQLLAALDKSIATGFPDGTRLLGKRYVPGVDPKLELYFLASAPLATDSMFEVTSSVDAAPWWSLVPADDKIKVYGQAFFIAPRLWRKGFIYVERVDLRFRPGREYFAGYFDTTGALTATPGRPPHGYGVYLMTSK
jgi:hypothetical protein